MDLQLPSRTFLGLVPLLLLAVWWGLGCEAAANKSVSVNFTAVRVACGGPAAASNTSGSLRNLSGVSDGRSCAVECALDAGCSGFRHADGLCQLADFCQVHAWLESNASAGESASAVCPVLMSSSRVKSRVGAGLSDGAVVELDFRGVQRLLVDWRTECSARPLVQLSNALSGPGGVTLAGRTDSYALVDTSSASLSDFVFSSDQTVFSIFIKLTRIFIENMMHYIWWSECDGTNPGLILKEWYGNITFTRSIIPINRKHVWTAPSIPVDQSAYRLISIGVTVPGANQPVQIYFNGTTVAGSLVNNSTISGSIGNQCLFLGRTPNSSPRSLNGTIHCLKMFNRAVNHSEMQQLDSACTVG